MVSFSLYSFDVTGYDRTHQMNRSKCTSRSQAVEKYGAIDFSSRHWPDQNQWLKMFEVPKGFFPDWKVMETDLPCTHFMLNLDAHYPMLNALESVHNLGLGHLLHTFDGCFNIRMVRGTNNMFSAHSYGLAIDINAAENPLGCDHGGFYNYPEFIKCFTNQGWDWGGHWVHRKDPMHFSYCWE